MFELFLCPCANGKRFVRKMEKRQREEWDREVDRAATSGAGTKGGENRAMKERD